jgi:uncharacterized RDD family membrane protein YckC
MASQPNIASSWKQEVNRRVAAHNSRRGLSTVEQKMPAEVRQSTTSLAAQAAARVAARYAKAPTYSQMQAAEARTAVRAAQIATQAALEAQAAAQAVLANIESTAGPAQSFPPPSPVRSALRPQDMEPEMPVPPEAAETARQPRQVREFEPFPSPVEDWWQPTAPGSQEVTVSDRQDAAVPELPAHANLIEFPREAAGARNPRSWHADAPNPAPASPEAQLSIFEVDPEPVSPQVEPEAAPPQPGASQWSGIELEARSLDDLDPQAAPPTETAGIELATFGRRLLAAVVDGALIAGALLAAASVAAVNMDRLPSVRLIEMGAAAALFVTGLLYQALFFTFADATPGMKYARLSLCTFDDQSPTRAQLHGRLGALLLSLLPLGLGVLWAIFDEDHLSWHDRLSKTYQRKCVP